MSDESWSYRGPSAPGDAPPLLAGRYLPGRLIGSGAYGAVHEAVDTVTGATVALKLLRSADALRREASALRRLRLPGVVRMLDEGIDEGRAFLVMELVEGDDFPPPPRVAWSRLAEPVATLLAALDALHAAGALHLDLKPSNLRETPDGRVVVLDLGLACFDAGGATAGNRRYAAPEQREAGAVDRRADLFAVAAMLWEALAGTLDPDAPAAAPPHVVAALRQTLAHAPAARPPDARTVADLLGILQPPLEVPPGPFPESLRAMFVGPDRVLHLQADAASAVWEEAEQDQTRVAAVLDAWQRRGLAVRDGSRLRVDRATLDRLGDDATGSDESLEARIARFVGHGRSPAALAACAEAFGLAEPSQRPRIARLWLLHAVSAGVPGALDPVLHALGRLPAAPTVARLEHVARAAVLTQTGEGGRALPMLRALPLGDDADLDLCVLTLRVQAAGKIGVAEEERELAAVEGLALPWLAPRMDVWRGRLRYGQGRFAEAARFLERAARRATTPMGRLSALLNVVAAWLELGHWREAAEQAALARHLAAEMRAPLLEARAEWLGRACAYRSGTQLVVDGELVEAAQVLGVPYLAGAIALNEAAIAWRAGEDPDPLARLAGAAFRRGGMPSAAALADALRLAVHFDAEEAAAVWESVRRRSVPDLDWQSAGLLALAAPDGPWAAAAGWAAEAPRPHLRRDVLAPHEVRKPLTPEARNATTG